MRNEQADNQKISMPQAMLGLVLAGVAGYLFANQKARKNIKGKLIDSIEKGDDKLDAWHDRLSEKIDFARERAAELSESGRKRLARELDTAKQKLEESTEKLEKEGKKLQKQS